MLLEIQNESFKFDGVKEALHKKYDETITVQQKIKDDFPEIFKTIEFLIMQGPVDFWVGKYDCLIGIKNALSGSMFKSNSSCYSLLG